MVTFDLLYESLANEPDPWLAVQSIQSYVSRALAWAFADRMQPTGSFQHTFTPDFYIHLQPGPKLAVHMRFSDVSARTLIADLAQHKRDDFKHLVLVRGVTHLELTDRISKSFKRKNILATTFGFIDEIMRVVRIVEEHGPYRLSLRLPLLRKKLESWCLETTGWKAAPRLEDFMPRLSLDVATAMKDSSATLKAITLWSSGKETGERAIAFLRDSTAIGTRRLHHRRLTEVKHKAGYELIYPIVQTGIPSVLVTQQDGRTHHPLLSCTFSRHAPMGQNAFQLMTSAVASVENGVPFFLVSPDRLAVQRRDGAISVEKMHPILLQAFLRMMEIHRVPCMFLPWPTDDRGEGPEFREDPRFPSMPDRSSGIIQLLFQCLNMALMGKRAEDVSIRLLGYGGVVRRRLEMEEAKLKEGATVLEVPPAGSGTLLPTGSLPRHFGSLLGARRMLRLLENVESRSTTLVFKTDSQSLRSDPYLGTLLAYDYAFCRIGARPTDRATNVIAHFREVSLLNGREALWTDPDRMRYSKSVRASKFLKYCDAMVFRDGYLVKVGDQWIEVE